MRHESACEGRIEVKYTVPASEKGIGDGKEDLITHAPSDPLTRNFKSTRPCIVFTWVRDQSMGLTSDRPPQCHDAHGFGGGRKRSRDSPIQISMDLQSL